MQPTLNKGAIDSTEHNSTHITLKPQKHQAASLVVFFYVHHSSVVPEMSRNILQQPQLLHRIFELGYFLMHFPLNQIPLTHDSTPT